MEFQITPFQTPPQDCLRSRAKAEIDPRAGIKSNLGTKILDVHALQQRAANIGIQYKNGSPGSRTCFGLAIDIAPARCAIPVNSATPATVRHHSLVFIDFIGLQSK